MSDALSSEAKREEKYEALEPGDRILMKDEKKGTIEGSVTSVGWSKSQKTYNAMVSFKQGDSDQGKATTMLIPQCPPFIYIIRRQHPLTNAISYIPTTYTPVWLELGKIYTYLSPDDSQLKIKVMTITSKLAKVTVEEDEKKTFWIHRDSLRCL